MGGTRSCTRGTPGHKKKEKNRARKIKSEGGGKDQDEKEKSFRQENSGDEEQRKQPCAMDGGVVAVRSCDSEW